jgi:hypothetical protein
MVGRPCIPNGDLKRLWQFLLPDAPFPQCGSPEDADATGRTEALLAQKRPAGAKPTAADPKA